MISFRFSDRKQIILHAAAPEPFVQMIQGRASQAKYRLHKIQLKLAWPELEVALSTAENKFAM